jgi:hypothetical protein
MFDTSETRLKNEAKSKIEAAEARVKNNSKDPLPRTWTGRLYIPLADNNLVISHDVHVGGTDYHK